MVNNRSIREILVDEWENKLTFVDQLREKYDYLYQKIVKHPFLIDIEKGKLPLKKFLAYAKQNEYYISELRAAAGAGAARAATDSERRIMIAIQQIFPLDVAEYSFGKLAVEAGIPGNEIRNILEDPDFPLPATRAYTDFMYKEFATKPAGVAIAGFISCPWSYSSTEIGGISCAKTFAQALYKHYGLKKEIADKYTYDYESWDLHDTAIKALKDAVNKTATEGDSKTKLMIESNFKRDVEYEYMFWDMAYKHDPDKTRRFGAYF
jgi:thiaminase/transcriptional activator TenA